MSRRSCMILKSGAAELLRISARTVLYVREAMSAAFRRAEELAMDMEARCYHGGEGRTRLHVLKFTWRDGVGTAAFVALIALIALDASVFVTLFPMLSGSF